MSTLLLPGVARPKASLGGLRLGMDVAKLAAKFGAAVSCGICALGIAIDLVGQMEGDAPYDWRQPNTGHACKQTERGLSGVQLGNLLRILEQHSPKQGESSVPRGVSVVAGAAGQDVER